MRNGKIGKVVGGGVINSPIMGHQLKETSSDDVNVARAQRSWKWPKIALRGNTMRKIHISANLGPTTPVPLSAFREEPLFLEEYPATRNGCMKVGDTTSGIHSALQFQALSAAFALRQYAIRQF
jgi:hypothetical protein